MEDHLGDKEESTTVPLLDDDRSSGEESSMAVSEEGKTSDSVSYVCEHCGKKFSCGKGLGGHKRVHAQSSKQDSRKKINFGTDRGVSEDDQIHNCNICGKNFASVKALYGHLRSHPDRPFRGAKQQLSPRYDSSPNPNPSPDSCPIESKPENEENHIMDLPDHSCLRSSVMSSGTAPLSGSAPASALVSDLRVEEQDTLSALLLLARREAPLVDFSSSRPKDKAEKRKIVDSEMKKKKKKKRRKNIMEVHHSGKAVRGRDDDRCDARVSHTKVKMYFCHPCNKYFSSCQAYGGHVSSHNKSPPTQLVSTSAPPSTLCCTGGLDVGHNDRSPPNQASRRVLDFDLNEFPPEEEEIVQ